MMKENIEIERVYLLKVYNEMGVLIDNVMPFRSEAGAQAAAADLVPAGRRYEIVAAEVSD